MTRISGTAATLVTTLMAAFASPSAQAGSVETRPYLPLKKGYSWSYEIVFVHENERKLISEIDVEILERSRVGIYTEQSRHRVIPPEDALPSKAKNKPLAFESISYLRRNSQGLSSKNEATAHFALRMPRRVKKGQAWQSSGEKEGTDCYSNFAGYAEVKIGAKTYKRCLKVVRLIMGEGKPEKRTDYYARGIGLVRIEKGNILMDLLSFQKSPRPPQESEICAAAKRILKKRAREILAKRAADGMVNKGIKLKRRPAAKDIQDAHASLTSVEVLRQEEKCARGWWFRIGFRGRFRGSFSILDLDERLEGQARVLISRNSGRCSATAIKLFPTTPENPEPASEEGDQAAPTEIQVDHAVRDYIERTFVAKIRTQLRAEAASKNEEDRQKILAGLSMTSMKATVRETKIVGRGKRVTRGWSFTMQNKVMLKMEVLGESGEDLVSWNGSVTLSQSGSGSWTVIEEDFKKKKSPAKD